MEFSVSPGPAVHSSAVASFSTAHKQLQGVETSQVK